MFKVLTLLVNGADADLQWLVKTAGMVRIPSADHLKELLMTQYSTSTMLNSSRSSWIMSGISWIRIGPRLIANGLPRTSRQAEYTREWHARPRVTSSLPLRPLLLVSLLVPLDHTPSISWITSLAPFSSLNLCRGLSLWSKTQKNPLSRIQNTFVKVSSNILCRGCQS
jgi:hypothetical protein